MVFERIKKALIPKKRDPFDPKGLEEFSKGEQERILGRIATKESELLKRRADVVAEKRIERLERKLGIKERSPKDRKSIGEKLQTVREFRQKNLAKRAERLKQMTKQEEDFRAGRLKIKPVGDVQKAKETMDRMKAGTGKLQMKEIKLKAPPGGL